VKTLKGMVTSALDGAWSVHGIQLDLGVADLDLAQGDYDRDQAVESVRQELTGLTGRWAKAGIDADGQLVMLNDQPFDPTLADALLPSPKPISPTPDPDAQATLPSAPTTPPPATPSSSG
jgi:hypothetical protein